MTHAAQHYVESLPSYRALLVVDVKDFSGQKGRRHAQITEEIPEILRRSFVRVGLIDIWDGRQFEVTTGDGYAVGFRSESLPFLLNPFLGALQKELADRDAVGWMRGHGQPLRMRASVNVGPMTDSGGNRLGDGSGDARVEGHRLVDSEPVKRILTRAGEATYLAAIVSERVFVDAVASGYSDEDGSLYVPVNAVVKTYQDRAYLRVPNPSGGLLRNGFSTDPTSSNVPDRSHGEIESRSLPSVSTIVRHSAGPLHTGLGDQYNAPRERHVEYNAENLNIVDRNEGGIRQSSRRGEM